MPIMTIRSLTSLVLASTALATGCSAPQPQQPAFTYRQVPQYTIEEFLGTTRLVGAWFSPDEQTILLSSDESGVFNAYSVPVTGERPTRLTDSTTDSIFAVSYFPGDERFVYERDRGGNELNHIYVRELDGSNIDLTPGENLKADFLVWAHDNGSFYFSTNERDPRYFDVYQMHLDGYRRELVFRNDGGFSFGCVSPDDNLLALTKTHSRTDNDVFIFDRQTGEMVHLTPHVDQITYSPEAFGPDGHGLYLITDEGSEFSYLVFMDLDTGYRQVLLSPDWDVWYARLSHDGTYLVAGINDDARTDIRMFRADSMSPIDLPDLPGGDITSLRFSPSEKKLAFYVNGSRAPDNLYVYELDSGHYKQLTNTLYPGMKSEHLVDARGVRFPSFDGVEIPALLYRPHTAAPDRKSPALIWVHGGPGGQSRIGYHALTQYLVNSGYVVLAVNNRGSTGYGKTFFLMDDRRHGSADLDDCLAGRDYLTGLGYVDPDQIGIIGGSYGGYMVLAALAFRPDAFAAGIDMFGISNWVRTLESMPPWWESVREALYREMGDPDEDRDYLYSISPLFHASQIRKPLMVLQGANDPRVLKVESDEIVEAVRAAGVPVEYVLFDDEGHGFRKRENRLRGYKAVLDFCDRYLRQAPQTVASR